MSDAITHLPHGLRRSIKLRYTHPDGFVVRLVHIRERASVGRRFGAIFRSEACEDINNFNPDQVAQQHGRNLAGTLTPQT